MFVIITSYSCNIFSCLLFQGKETYILCTYKKCFQWKQIHFKKTIFSKLKTTEKKENQKSYIHFTFYVLLSFAIKIVFCFILKSHIEKNEYIISIFSQQIDVTNSLLQFFSAFVQRSARCLYIWRFNICQQFNIYRK